MLDCSFQTTFEPEPFPETVARIEGEGGTLELARGYQLKLHRRGSVETIDAVPPVPAWGEKPWHCIQDSVVATQSTGSMCWTARAKPSRPGPIISKP